MNPDRINRLYRDEALAKQITATEYSTFVAMPFKDTYSYHSKKIYREVIQEAANLANQKGATRRKFTTPKRVDDGSKAAIVITEEIRSSQIINKKIHLTSRFSCRDKCGTSG